MKEFITITVVFLVIVFGFFFVSKYFKAEETNNNSNNITYMSPKPAAELKIEVLKEGTGEEAKNKDVVTVHYVGTLLDGTKFDSSVDRDTPFSFTLGSKSVIEGWEKGVLGMKVGEKRKLTIPPELGYGDEANGAIPANSTLVFEVEMIKINVAEK